MNSLWMVVADESKAEIYDVDERKIPARVHEQAVLVDVITNPTARTDVRDFKSDVPGTSRSDFGGHAFGLAQRTSPDEVARDRYAALVAERLNGAYVRGEVTSFALVMAPRLLGLVRAHLHNAARQAVVTEVHHRRVDVQVERVVREVLDRKGTMGE